MEMMHDFVDSHRDRPALTESFKSIAEKHMTKLMDLRGTIASIGFSTSGSMALRFRAITSITSLALRTREGEVAYDPHQSDVDDKFVMLVPVFADFGKGWIRIGQLGIKGNTTRTADAELPSAPKKVGLNVYKEILER